jgi:hypothetical protein
MKEISLMDKSMEKESIISLKVQDTRVTTSKDNVKDMEKSTMEMGSSLTSET